MVNYLGGVILIRTICGGAEYVGQIVGPAGYAPQLEVTKYNTIEDLNPDTEQYHYNKGSGVIKTADEDLLPGKYIEDNENKYNDEIQYIYCSVRGIDGKETVAYLGFKFPYLVIDYEAHTVDPYYHRSNDTSDFINENLIERDDDELHPFYQHHSISIPKGIHGDSLKNFRIINANKDIEEYTGQENDITGSRKVLVYDYYNYDKDGSGEPKTLFLGDYNIINNIDVSREGTVTIDYSHNDTQIYNKLFKWIDSISLNTNTGLLNIRYNHLTDANGVSTTYQTYLNWVKEIDFQDDGTVSLTYTKNANKNYTKLIKWITNTSMDTNGTITIEYNTGETQELTNTVKFISNITIDEPTQKIKVTYNDDSFELIGTPINYIQETTVRSTDYHLLVLYSDPEKQGDITYNDKNGWIDLGPLKDASGILIGYHITESMLDGNDGLTYLNTNYPLGLTDENVKGHIVTVSNNGEEIFYAFDYKNNQWYSLGSLAATNTTVLVGKETDSETQAIANSMLTGGVWFVVEGSDD